MALLEGGVVIPFVISFVVLFVAWRFASWMRHFRSMCKACRQIPGPPTRWLIGNMHQIHDAISYMKTTADVMEKHHARMYKFWIGPCAVLGVTHPDTAKILLRSAAPKALGIQDPYRMMLPWVGDGLLTSNGRKWERNRRLLTHAFHFEILQNYFPVYNKVTEMFLNKMTILSKNDQSVELFAAVSEATLDVMLKCSLSYEGSVQNIGTRNHPYVDSINELSRLLFQRMLNPLLFSDFIYALTPFGRTFAKHCRLAHAFTVKIIASRKEMLEFRPERFEMDNKIERDPFDFVPFSAGPRNCIGQNFALQEQKVMMARFVRMFKVDLDPTHKVQLLPEVISRAKGGLYVKLERRQ